MAQAPDEIFDVVDQHDRVIGQAARPAVHARRLLHRAVHILLFNNHQELLVQKRSNGKDMYPGCYDSSASGHLQAGESYDAAAVRETQEELGVPLPAVACQQRFKLAAGAETDWEFVGVYTGPSDRPVQPNPAEVESVHALSRAQIESLMAAQPELFARAFRFVFREVCARNLFPSGR